jgi:hypothetical protein
MPAEFPTKDARETLEIDYFLDAYARGSNSGRGEIVTKREKPDYVVRLPESGAEIGVKLTSVYLDDRSVPDIHLKSSIGNTDIPFYRAEINRYKQRLVESVLENAQKARNGYDLSRPLILGIYVNEYIAIYLGKDDLECMVRNHGPEFDSICPISEVVFFGLGDGAVFSVKPNNSVR